MADKVFRKNNFYERPWTSLLRRGFLENLRGECSWIRVPYSCYVFRDSGNIFRVHCSPPSPSLPQLQLFHRDYRHSVQCQTCMGKYIFGDEKRRGKCVLSGVKWFSTLHRKFVISFCGGLFNSYSVESMENCVVSEMIFFFPKRIVLFCSKFWKANIAKLRFRKYILWNNFKFVYRDYWVFF